MNCSLSLSERIRMISQKSDEIALDDGGWVELEQRVRVVAVVHECNLPRRAQPLHVQQAVVPEHIVPTGHHICVRNHLQMIYDVAVMDM